MGSPLGFHVLGHLRDRAWFEPFLNRVRPRGVLLMEGARDQQYWGLWHWCRQNGILVGYRPYIENQDAANADELADQVIHLVLSGFPVDFVQGKNQNYASSETDADGQADFDLRMAQRLAPYGVGYAPYMAYEHKMEWDGSKLVGHYLDKPKVRAALTHPNVRFIITHEYFQHPADAFLDNRDASTYVGRETWVYGPWGWATWWVNRHRMWHWHLRQAIPGWNVKVAVLESGIETYGKRIPGVEHTEKYPPWGGDKQGGAWSYTNAEDYARQIIRVHDEMWLESDELEMVCLFTHWTNGTARWDSYDTSTSAGHSTWEILGEHIIRCREEEIVLPSWITDVSQRIPRHATLVYPTRPLSAIEGIVIHHVGVEMNASDAENMAWRTANYHIKPRDGYPNGWAGIGYHFCIGNQGDIVMSQPLEVQSAHVWGRNRELLGICLEGGLHQRPPTSAQVAALTSLLGWLQGELGLTPHHVHGHFQVALPGHGTQCPGIVWWEAWQAEYHGGGQEVERLRQRIADLEAQVVGDHAAMRTADEAIRPRIGG